MNQIKLSCKSSKAEVKEFLRKLKNILCDENFDINRDFCLIRSKKSGPKNKYSTRYTMVDLDYDSNDVVEKLKELEIREYSETLFDMDDANPPLLFVFGKTVNGMQVYVKLKIKPVGKVLCVSFHYAEHKMDFPYA